MLALVIALLLAVALERFGRARALPIVLGVLAAASVVTLIALVVNHVRYPFQLDLMEGVVMQQARRAAHGQSIYPVPTPEFVPLAYNALYYLIAAPFLLLFGDTMATLRMVSVLGFVGSAAGIFFVVRRSARSTWWGAIAVGLFCAAYAAMDAYLDSAHSDSWLLCCAIWGTYLIGGTSRRAHVAGILTLIAGFWFKQHGAVFVILALAYLTWREGVKSAWAYWAIAIVFGPLLYFFAPGSLLGADFRYFTWQVPRGWSTFMSRGTPHVLVYNVALRVTLYLVTNFLVLAIAALVGVFRALRGRKIGILEVQLTAAFLTALMGAFDTGSSNNVFIPIAAFTIIYGTVELARWGERLPAWNGMRLSLVATLLAFAPLLRDPRPFWMPASARTAYADLQTLIRSLPGTVYAPGIGELADGPPLYPGAHWVALNDIIRGPRRTSADSALALRMLEPLRRPTATAFILTNRPLSTMAVPVNVLAPDYRLVHDYGDRFAPLAAPPRRYDHEYPRYLYESVSAGESTSGH
jgi:hypothetical protein